MEAERKLAEVEKKLLSECLPGPMDLMAMSPKSWKDFSALTHINSRQDLQGESR